MEEEIQRVLNDPLENLRFEQFSCATYIERLKLVAEEERYLKEICDNLYDKAYNELAVLVKSYADKEHIERRNFNFKLEAQKHELKFLGDCYGCKQSEIPDPGIALGCIINSVEYMYRTNDVFRTFLTNEEFIELFSKHIVQYQ